MTFIPIVVFSFALVAIITLFVLKRRELAAEGEGVSAWRQSLDLRAAQLKDLIRAAERDLQRVPPELSNVIRVLIRIGALGAARGARFFEVQSQRLADLVSHKHRFERRAPRSEFLNKIAEHKNGGANGTEDVSTEHNIRVQ